MYIKSLDLKNFRNYKTLSIELDKGTNILYGDNAQGKTNVLEAIYIGGTTKSHKGSKDRDVIYFNEEESHIRMRVHKEIMDYQIDMHLKKNNPKGIAINGVPIKRARDLFGVVNLVFFSPQDLNIIKDGPGERRRFLDFELCQLDGIYLNDLTNYNKSLNQRNKLLKDLYFQPDLISTLDIWDVQLVQYGKKIISKRQEFIDNLNSIIGPIHFKLTGGKENIYLEYEPNITVDLYDQQLQKNRESDCKLKTTSTGPHRDDLCVTVNGIDIRRYGSQGQQRTAALSLKLSEIELVKKIIKDTPVLLLDDVLSELDSSRQNYLLNSIKDIQTIITCTGLDDFVEKQFEVNKVFQVVAGGIK
ncbi:MAG: DNA replication/repair protein RecF [Lachnospiraceae bacterium]|nr:DNA replication/repair protein RecF [Lachnospiraceae bacterium]